MRDARGVKFAIEVETDYAQYAADPVSLESLLEDIPFLES
jgi:hypothetical protein